MAVKSVRLTQDMRYKITNAVCDDLYETEINQITELEMAAFRSVFEEVARGVPRAELEISGMRVSLARADGTGRQNIYLHAHQPGGPYRLTAGMHTEIRNDDAVDKWEMYQAATAKLRRKRSGLYSAVWNLLSSCSTTAQLLAAWPDGEKYLISILPAEKDKALNQERERRLKAAAVAKLFSDAGVDTLTSAEVPNAETETA